MKSAGTNWNLAVYVSVMTWERDTREIKYVEQDTEIYGKGYGNNLYDCLSCRRVRSLKLTPVPNGLFPSYGW